MNSADVYIKNQIENILTHGYEDKNPRPKYADGSPAYTLSVNGNFRRYDLSKGDFPITTLRPIAWKSAIKEILWIYQDQSNDLNLLRNKYNVQYWNEWESEQIPNTIGIRYGEIIRRHRLMDNLLEGLIYDPFGRRHIIDLYQYTDMNESDGLNPCAFCTIWNVRNEEEDGYYLDVSLIQRSGDLMAASCSGVNEVQYAALLMMVAKHCGYKVGVLYHYVANEQVYSRHFNQAKEMLNRYRKKEDLELVYDYENPNLILNTDNTDFYSFTIDNFKMVNYEPIKPQLQLPLGI